MDSNKPTVLCNIAYKYGTDKCPQIKHSYTPFYFQLLSDRRLTVKKVLELGIGYYEGMKENSVIYDPGLNRYYHRGASLYMWRDFFPNALIYGADIQPEAIFEDIRIKTYLCNERKKEDLENLITKVGTDVDLFVDDGSHHTNDQIFAAETLLPLLSKNIIYVIEDVGHTRLIKEALNKIGKFDYQIPDIPRKWKGGMLLVITKK